MPAQPELLATPNPALALRTDGYLVRLVPGSGPTRVPTTAEFESAADLAFARSIEILSKTPGELPLLVGPIVAVGAAAAAAAAAFTAVIGFVSAAITALELLGITESKYQPIFDRIALLHADIKKLLIAEDQTKEMVYADWAGAHWRDIDGLIGMSSGAVTAVYGVVFNHEDTSSPFVAQKLANAFTNSGIVVDSLIGPGIEGGYWMRPSFAKIVNFDSWSFKTDERPEVSNDFRVWDYRLALPTLLLAILSRVLVVKGIYPGPQANKLLCPEIRKWNRFLSNVIQRIQSNVRRKADFTAAEKAGHCDGSATTDFFAGAVDLTTGMADFVNFDPYGWTATDAYDRKKHLKPDLPGETTGRDWPGIWCPGGWIKAADFADTITFQDVVQAQSQNPAAIMLKQGLFAENRLLMQTPILPLCDLCGQLMRLCPEPPTLVGKATNSFFDKKRSLYVAIAGDGGAKKKTRDAYALVDMARVDDESHEDQLRASAALTAVMLDEREGSALRHQLRQLVRGAVRTAETLGEVTDAPQIPQVQIPELVESYQRRCNGCGRTDHETS